MSILNSKTERKRFIKFAFVGLTGTVVDFGVMNFLRIVAGLSLVWAQGISFAIAVLNNFLWNRLWTYPESRGKGATWQLIQFFLINVIGIAIRTPLIAWLDHRIFKLLNTLNINISLENYVISQNLALAVSISIVMLWNYFANRYWTFNNIPTKEEENA